MKYSRSILDITLSGVLLSLMLLMQFLEQYFSIKIASIKINLSLAFVLASYHLISKTSYPFMLLVLKFLIGPSLDKGYVDFNIWGHFLGFMAFSIGLASYILYMKLFLTYIDVWRSMIFSILLMTITIIFGMWFVNVYIGFPVYYWLLEIIPTPSISSASDNYNGFKFLHLNIPNYYAGIFVSNFLSNGIKDILSGAISLTLLRILYSNFETFNMDRRIKKIKEIKTTRLFNSKEVDPKIIEAIIETASNQPSSGFGQSFNIIKMSNEQKNQIYKLLPNQFHIKDAKCLLIFTADFNKIKYAKQKYNSDIENNMETLLLAAGDSFIAAQTANIVAQKNGLGTCFLSSIRGKIDEISKLLKLPKSVLPIVGLAIGYPEKTYDEPKRNKKAIIFNGEYDEDALKRSINEYDSKEIIHHIEFDNKNYKWSSWINEKFDDEKSKKIDKEIKKRW